MIRAAAVIGGVALSASLVAVQAVAAPVDVSNLAITAPPTSVAMPMGIPKKGQVQIIIRLSDPPLAAALGPNAKRTGIPWSATQQRAYLAQLKTKKDALMAQVSAMGGSEIARVSKVHNAVVAQIDASRVAEVARLPGVTKIRPVIDYELALSETVPYIGAKALQNLGVDGTNVKVAVLDSGIDYTHRNLGGPGTAAAYTACYGPNPASAINKMLPPPPCVYPTSKVVGGYDFVGEGWPNTALAPDPNPIGAPGPGVFAGVDGSHGTHVGDIIGGKSTDGLHVGVAPGTQLYAVKVCSSVSTACSGVALLEGMDFALDPNGDGDISDAVDVVNMSLGSNYGQREDDLSEASAIASRFGVVVVAAAGNAADRPYIVSSPSTTPEVISVAQTQVPSALAFPVVIDSPASIAGTYGNTATVDWAPVGAGASGAVAYVGRGCPAGSIDGSNPDDPYLANPAGKIALIDRGSCAVSLKVDRAANAGAIGVLIGLVASGDAISFSYGGGSTFVPTLVIQQSLSNSIKANINAPVLAHFSPVSAIALVGSMVGSSARGPGYSYVAIKPDIGAPGASVSAVSGSGTGEEAFGGTSGATPMIAGSAALLLQANPLLSPSEVKARLMNSAETNIQTNPAVSPGVLAPITRIGGGEVRVDKAFALTAAAWDAVDPASVGLSFGYNAATGTQRLMKKVTVRNYAPSPRTFSITPSFRFANDAASGAVTFAAPASINVPANGSNSFVMTMTLNATNLPTWPLNGGSNGGNGPLLNGPEYDGYVTFADGTDTFHLPWHILPHKADNLKVASNSLALGGGASGNIGISNIGGAVSGRLDTFALTGTSPRITTGLPQPGDNFAVIDLKSVGVRAVSIGGGQFGVQFAVTTFGGRSHPDYPSEFDVYVDTNNDGVFDYIIFNFENGGFGASGQTVVSVVNLQTGSVAGPFFFADADLNSANIILTAPLSALGNMPLGQKFNFQVFAFDNYFSGNLTDDIGPMTFTLSTPRFDNGGGFGSLAVPVGASGPIPVFKVAGGDAASPSQSGILLMYRDAKPGFESDAVTVTP
jgi:subtilisin family serine protease